jgi:hypothetical protein
MDFNFNKNDDFVGARPRSCSSLPKPQATLNEISLLTDAARAESASAGVPGHCPGESQTGLGTPIGFGAAVAARGADSERSSGMEIVEAVAGFFVAFVIVSAVMQVAFSYSLQVIAEKNELPDFASFLSWIPILNMYPLIRCGGGDFRKFMLGAVGFVVLGGASAAVSASVNPLVGGIAIGLMTIGMLVYMTLIVMHTAERRGIPKWVGLLTYVPPACFFVYPYIAFHDGFRPPHKIGVVIGLLIAFGPIPGQIKMLDTLTQSASAYEAAQGGDFSELTEAAETAGLGEMMDQMGPAMQLAAQMAALEQMDASDPGQAAAMRDQMNEVRQQIGAASEVLGDDANAQLEALLQQNEARLAAATGNDGSMNAGDTLAGAAPSQPAITDPIPRMAELGFDVPITAPCPAGSEMNGAAPPEGSKQWCSRPSGGLKHGWMTSWHENGQPELAGEYHDGLRIGVWTRWHPNGEKRVQAEFADGRQDGALIAWNEAGDVIHESRFASGELAAR